MRAKSSAQLFRDAEEIARALLDLRTEERRLRETLERITETRWIALGNLEKKARDAMQAHANEAAARVARGRKPGRKPKR